MFAASCAFLVFFGTAIGLDERAAPGTNDSVTVAQGAVLARCNIPRPGLAPTIPVTVFGETHMFLVDTGSTCSGFDTRFEKRLGPPLQQHVNLQSAGDTTRHKLYRGPAMMIGDFRLPDCPAVVCLDLSGCHDAQGEVCCGVIGLDILRSLVVQIDIERSEFRVLASASEDCGMAVPIHVDTRMTLTGLVPGFGDLRFMVDTGACRCSALKLHNWSFDCLRQSDAITHLHQERVSTMHGDRQDIAGTLDRFQLGSSEFSDCGVARWYESVLCWEFFAAHRKVTFDCPGMTMYVDCRPRLGDANRISASPLGKLMAGFHRHPPIGHQLQMNGDVRHSLWRERATDFRAATRNGESASDRHRSGSGVLDALLVTVPAVCGFFAAGRIVLGFPFRSGSRCRSLGTRV